ncbi:hypothetical protein GTW98_10935 [Streptomyces sp. SID8375]|uniref:hypothetical protein n=1 Tax=unclassified Streptomyces TaxID=2593676 RepID=UPI00131A0D55|nr:MULTISPECIES: hypothetical protein [unclassified Streptomyces]MYX07319.1 hypothetical protein [Streptomyces sp. SID8375]
MLTPRAARHLSTLTRTPPPPDAPCPPLLRDATHDTEAAAYWTRLKTEQQPVRACTLCTRRRSHDATGTAWFNRRRTG